MSFLLNPYAFLAAGGDFEPIATVTVGSGGASSITFSSIPGTYQHLQVRIIALSNAEIVYGLRLNSDSGTNYASHRLIGNGATVTSDGVTSQTQVDAGLGSATTSTPAASVIDILDYANTSKNTTVRLVSGLDKNGSGSILMRSGLWISTSAVSSITILKSGYTFSQHTTAALYGVSA